MIRSRLDVVTGFGITIRPPLGSVANAVIARSISAASRTLAALTTNPNEGAAASADRRNAAFAAVSMCRRAATRVTPGATFLSASSHFPPIGGSKCVNPVMLPPGCDKLSMNPLPTGSATLAKTIGMVRVAFCKAATPRLLCTRITAGAKPTSSLANAGNRSTTPSAHR